MNHKMMELASLQGIPGLELCVGQLKRNLRKIRKLLQIQPRQMKSKKKKDEQNNHVPLLTWLLFYYLFFIASIIRFVPSAIVARGQAKFIRIYCLPSSP